MRTESITGTSAVSSFAGALKNMSGYVGSRQPDETGAEREQFLEAQKKAAEEQKKAAEELKRRQQQKQEEQQRKQELDMLQKELEASKKEAENMEDMFEAFAKCIKIAARISKGDIVPMKDIKFLAEHEPDMYKQAILMRMPNDKPKKHKSLVDDEDEESDSTQSADSSSGSGSSEDLQIAEQAPETAASEGESGE